MPWVLMLLTVRRSPRIPMVVGNNPVMLVKRAEVRHTQVAKARVRVRTKVNERKAIKAKARKAKAKVNAKELPAIGAKAGGMRTIGPTTSPNPMGNGRRRIGIMVGVARMDTLGSIRSLPPIPMLARLRCNPKGR